MTTPRVYQSRRVSRRSSFITDGSKLGGPGEGAATTEILGADDDVRPLPPIIDIVMGTLRRDTRRL